MKRSIYLFHKDEQSLIGKIGYGGLTVPWIQDNLYLSMFFIGEVMNLLSQQNTVENHENNIKVTKDKKIWSTIGKTPRFLTSVVIQCTLQERESVYHEFVFNTRFRTLNKIEFIDRNTH